MGSGGTKVQTLDKSALEGENSEKNNGKTNCKKEKTPEIPNVNSRGGKSWAFKIKDRKKEKSKVAAKNNWEEPMASTGAKSPDPASLEEKRPNGRIMSAGTKTSSDIIVERYSPENEWERNDNNNNDDKLHAKKSAASQDVCRERSYWKEGEEGEKDLNKFSDFQVLADFIKDNVPVPTRRNLSKIPSPLLRAPLPAPRLSLSSSLNKDSACREFQNVQFTNKNYYLSGGVNNSELSHENPYQVDENFKIASTNLISEEELSEMENFFISPIQSSKDDEKTEEVSELVHYDSDEIKLMEIIENEFGQ